MSRQILYTVDVEFDLHHTTDKGIREGLVTFEKVCDKFGIKPTLFIVAKCIPSNSKLFKRLSKKGWELALHGYSHNRFDEMSSKQKEEEIKKSLAIFKKFLGEKPKGFRAPQHSIDRETLRLLDKYGFAYDSSTTPLNGLQLFFFPSKFFLWIRSFFSPLNEYTIYGKLRELPTSALAIPFVSLTVRVLPNWFLAAYVKLITLIYKKPVFYAHSWDFISLPDSRIDRTFPHTDFIAKLEKVMENNNAYS